MNTLDLRTHNLELLAELATARDVNDEATVQRVADELLRINDRLVSFGANRFSTVLPRDEAYAAAQRGLLHAIMRYKAEHGTALSTYAMWWMRKFVQTATTDYLKHASRRSNDPSLPERLASHDLLDSDVADSMVINDLLAELTENERHALFNSRSARSVRQRARVKVLHPSRSELAGPWTEHAACQGVPVSKFIHRSRTVDGLTAVCESCPVAVECAAFATRHRLSGWWSAPRD